MGMFGLFGSESKSKSYSTSTTITKPADQRVGVEGGMYGTLVGPEAGIAEGGGVVTRTGDYSPLTQTITGNKYRVGMSGPEVAELLRQQSLSLGAAGDASADANERLARLATTALSSQSGVPADWQKMIIPLAVIAGAVLIARRRHT